MNDAQLLGRSFLFRSVSLLLSDVCLLQLDEGPCRGDIERYYYNTITQKCEVFSYGGCQGNANNFKSYQQCHKTCFRIPSKFLSPKAVAGRWWWWLNEGVLSVTWLYLCYFGVNLIVHDAHSHCIIFCIVFQIPIYILHFFSSTEVPQICRFPKEEGPCRALFRSYYFNMTTMQCELFYYGGCHGNSNRFPDLTSCMEYCSPRKSQWTRLCCVMPLGVCACACHLLSRLTSFWVPMNLH